MTMQTITPRDAWLLARYLAGDGKVDFSTLGSDLGKQAAVAMSANGQVDLALDAWLRTLPLGVATGLRDAVFSADPAGPEPTTPDLLSHMSHMSQPREEKRPWPAPPAGAFIGLAGEVVNTVDPHTEADRTAVLLSFLTMFGAAIGNRPHFKVGATRHTPRLFSALVGRTSKSRKGDSLAAVRLLVEIADPDFVATRVLGGLVSGEGLIFAVRDAVTAQQPIKEKGRTVGYEEVQLDPGETDKRLLAVEPEFARVLKASARETSTLSELIRQAWDGGDLRNMTKNSPLKATQPHITLLTHITAEELGRELSDSVAANGFGNRFLFCLVRRSKLLPDPEPLEGPTVNALGMEIHFALRAASRVERMERTPAARELWAAIYPELARETPGLAGSLTARAEAQTLRLSMLFALLDGGFQIDMPHLEAAVALWRYCQASVHWLFGDASGDNVADIILKGLRANGELTRTDIRDLFGRHASAGRLDHALGGLLSAGLAKKELRESGGRPVEVWRAVSAT